MEEAHSSRSFLTIYQLTQWHCIRLVSSYTKGVWVHADGNIGLKGQNVNIRLEKTCFIICMPCQSVAYREGGFGRFKPSWNSEVLTKLSRIPCSVENTSVTV
jgi:hypothetical protein